MVRKLKLAGNCHPDLAGWKFRIVRTDPIPDWADKLQLDGIATDQTGTIGDVTADQMIKHFECSPKEFVERSLAGDQPETTWRKCLYLEWFSHRNGRAVTRLAIPVRVGLPFNPLRPTILRLLEQLSGTGVGCRGGGQCGVLQNSAWSRHCVHLIGQERNRPLRKSAPVPLSSLTQKSPGRDDQSRST